MVDRNIKLMIFSVATITLMTDFALLFSFGALYVEMLEEYQTGRAETAIVQALLLGVGLGSGVISGALIIKIGLPCVTLLSSILVPLGFIVSYYATAIYHLYISIGILSAFGISLAQVSCYTVTVRVFSDRQQLICMTVLTTATGISSLTYPYLLTWLDQNYGLSGTFIILGGISGNTFLLFTTCFVYRREISEKPYTRHLGNINHTSDNTMLSNANRSAELHHISKNEDSTIFKITGSVDQNRPKDKIQEYEDTLSIDIKQSSEIHCGDYLEKAAHRDGSVSSEQTTHENRSDDKHLNESQPKTRNRCVSNAVETFKNLLIKPYICLAVAFWFGIVSLNAFLPMIVDIASWKGLLPSQGIHSLLAFNIFNIIGRLVPGLLKQRKGINSFMCPVLSTLSGLFGQLLLYFSTNLTMYIIGVSLSGLACGGILSSSLNATIRIVSLDQVPVAIGFLNTVNGLLSIAIGPIFGGLRDRTGSYGSVLLTISISQSVSAFFYVVSFFFRYKKNRKSGTTSCHTVN